MLNRRQAIGAAIGAAVSFILPAPRRHIDLMQFCCRFGDDLRYDLSLPWEHEERTYATDGRICVRVRPESGDRRQREGRMPPFDKLAWDHDRLRGWKEFPRLTPLLASQSQCPACEGTGFAGGAIGHDCETCYGTGHKWVREGWGLSRPIPCRGCAGKGVVAPPGAVTCPTCQGEALGTFPSIVRIGPDYFDAALVERVRSLGAEYVIPENCDPAYSLMRFRFDGGAGLLMGIDRRVEHRLVKGA